MKFLIGLALGIVLGIWMGYSFVPRMEPIVEAPPLTAQDRFVRDRLAEGCTWLYYSARSQEYMGCGIHITVNDAVVAEYIGDYRFQ
jgi:hypothetical protein